MIASVIRTCFPVAAQAVADKAEEINKLNVFPVPDGDTGTQHVAHIKHRGERASGVACGL